MTPPYPLFDRASFCVSLSFASFLVQQEKCPKMASHPSLCHNLVSAVRKTDCYHEQSSIIRIPRSGTNHCQRQQKTTRINSALKSRKGFGPSPKKTRKDRKPGKNLNADDDEDKAKEEEEDNDPSAGVIPEVVTNRMMKRMGFSVGIPLSIGLMFFPLFYYLKVGLKVDVPTWVPFIVSFFFFGSALLGVSYGIVSSSWDPLREGSLLGWNEAQKNWPVFWQSIWGGGGGGNSRNK